MNGFLSERGSALGFGSDIEIDVKLLILQLQNHNSELHWSSSLSGLSDSKLKSHYALGRPIYAKNHGPLKICLAKSWTTKDLNS